LGCVGVTTTGVRIADAGEAVGTDAKALDCAQRLERLLQFLLAGRAPDHLTHRIAGLDRRRQIGRVLRPDNDLGAVASAIHKLVGRARNLRHSPVVEKTLGLGHVGHAKDDCIDTRQRHTPPPFKYWPPRNTRPHRVSV
jgi:hypothetical protein